MSAANPRWNPIKNQHAKSRIFFIHVMNYSDTGMWGRQKAFVVNKQSHHSLYFFFTQKINES